MPAHKSNPYDDATVAEVKRLIIEEELSLAEACRRLQLVNSRIRKQLVVSGFQIPDRRGVPITSKETEAIEDLFLKGHSLTDIANKVGVAVSTVHRYLSDNKQGRVKVGISPSIIQASQKMGLTPEEFIHRAVSHFVRFTNPQ